MADSQHTQNIQMNKVIAENEKIKSIFPSVVIFFLFERLPLHILFCRFAGDEFFALLSGKVFISLSYLKDNFARYIILGW